MQLGLAQQPSATPSLERGNKVVQTPAAPQGHRYVVAIGINEYAAWPHLDTAVNDARGFSALLHDTFGFDLAAPPLLEKEATQRNIVSLLDDLRTKLKPEDDLVIFFAGHGTTRKDQIGSAISSVGFLVPVDARASGPNEHWSDYIQVDEFLRNVSTLPAAHILVILDSCHSGIALGNKFVTRADLPRYSEDLSHNLSRKVIASSEASQTAADGNGPLPNHSLFTGTMMQGLTSGKADKWGEGLITASELGDYAQHQVSNASASHQTPAYGAFDLDAGGEVLFHINSDFAALYHQARASLMVPDEKAFLAVAQKAIELKPEAPEALWLKYRSDLAQQKIKQAEEDLDDLRQRYYRDNFSLDTIPLDVRTAGSLGFRLHYWSQALAAPATTDKLDISVSILGSDGKEAPQTVAPFSIVTLPKSAAFSILVTNRAQRPLSIGALFVSDSGEIDVATANPDDTEKRVRRNADDDKLLIMPDGTHVRLSSLNPGFAPDSHYQVTWLQNYGISSYRDDPALTPEQRAAKRAEAMDQYDRAYFYNPKTGELAKFGPLMGTDSKPDPDPSIMVFPGQTIRWDLRGDGQESVGTFQLLLSPYTIPSFINPPSTSTRGFVSSLDAPGVTQTSITIRQTDLSATAHE